jgi:hypothetical protein
MPRTEQKAAVTAAKREGLFPLSVSVWGAARPCGEYIPTFKALSTLLNPEIKATDLTLFEAGFGACQLGEIA